MVSVFARGISPDPSLPKELKGRSVEDLIRGVMKAPRPIKENPEYPLDLKEVVKNLFIDEKTHKAAQEVADAFEEITVPSKDRYQKDIRYGSGEPHKKRDNFP